jgi:hypothetical protein
MKWSMSGKHCQLSDLFTATALSTEHYLFTYLLVEQCGLTDAAMLCVTHINKASVLQ